MPPSPTININLSRDNVRHKIFEILNNKPMSENMEKACLNVCLQVGKKKKMICRWENKIFLMLYINKVKQVLYNIDPKNNRHIYDKLKNKETKSYEVPFMTHQELNPAIWEPIIKEKIKRDKSKYEINMEAATEEFTCYRCGKNKCTYYELQTRSADEPMTTYVSCLHCGNHWKC